MAFIIFDGLRVARLRVVTLCAVVTLGAVGCHQGGMYQASSLPVELRAPRFSSIQNFDLSQLARSSGDSQVLYPGDVVEVTVATGLEEDEPLSAKVRVSEEGSVTIPLVGAVAVAGLELTQAERVIHAESIRRGQFVNPNVSVLLSTRRSNRITVVGAVGSPGTYELPVHNSDVLNALVHAGGVTEDAGTVIELRHPPRPGHGVLGSSTPGGNARLVGHPSTASYPTAARVVRVDLERPDATTNDLSLEDGSTVMVMKKPKRFVHVMGLVDKADQYEIPDDQPLRLLDAIAMAGGRTMELADEVHVIRQIPNQPEPILIEASVNEAKRNGSANIPLAPGDVVSVEETALTFTVGTIRDFVRFGFSTAIPMF